jgi:hypothetical protein
MRAIYLPSIALLVMLLAILLAVLTILAVWSLNGISVHVADAGTSDIVVDDAGRLLHLMKDHAHVAGWLIVKLALRLGANYHTYFCPPSSDYQARIVVVVSDETNTMCALAIIRALPNADGTNSLITSFCRPCAKVASLLKRDSCVPLMKIRFMFP